MCELSFMQWAGKNGRTTQHDVESHTHAGLRSAPTTKTYARFFDRKRKRLQASADASKEEYEALVAFGKIKSPIEESRLIKLQRTANGDPNNYSTQSALRLLKKRGEAL